MTPEDAQALKGFAESMGLTDCMPGWMSKEIKEVEAKSAKVGTPVTRQEALEVSKQTLENAEKERSAQDAGVRFDDRQYWFDIDGKKEPDEEAMLAKLLDEGYLFCNGRKFADYRTAEVREETVVLFVLANDIFCYAADAESLPLAELPKLFKRYQDHGASGVVQWLCLRRNEQPLKKMAERLKAEGAWTEELEKLHPNYCELKLKTETV